jgi:hypothetical protein
LFGETIIPKGVQKPQNSFFIERTFWAFSVKNISPKNHATKQKPKIMRRNSPKNHATKQKRDI